MKKLNFLIGFFLIAGFASLQATASEENNELEVYNLGEIVVSAEGKGVEAIGTVREVTSEEIELSGAQTLDDALRLLPGIMVRTGGQGVPRPDLRGMKPRHVTLLIDGIPFNSAGDGQFDPSLISTENIAKIKVSYGNDSVLYGPGGLGGVINVITKKGTEKTKFGLEGRYMDRSDKLLRTNLSGGNSRINYFLSASGYDSNGYKLSDDFTPTDYEDGYERENSDRELGNVMGNIGFTPNEKSQIGLIINYITGEQGIPPITLDRDDPFGKNPKYERIDDQEGLSFNLSGSYDFDGPFSMRGWIFHNNYEELKNGYDADSNYTTQEAGGSYSFEETTKIKGANLQTKYISDNYGRLALSLGTKTESFDYVGWEKRNNGSNNEYDESHEIKTHTIAAEYEIEPFENAGFVAGYGYSWFKKENGKDDSTGNYLIGLNYTLSKNSRIKASVADKVRFPSVDQLYGSEGNEDLTYEKSMNYEIGFEHNMSSIKTAFSITGFRRDVENYIAKVEIDDEDINMNHEEYLFQGVEVTATNHSVENLDLSLAYTYMDTEDKSAGSLVDEVQYNPQHKLALTGNYNFSYGISAYASIERIENQYYYNSNNTLKGKLPDYTLVNFKIEKEVPNSGLKLYIGANNLFDENYFESYALPREGRIVFAGFKFSTR